MASPLSDGPFGGKRRCARSCGGMIFRLGGHDREPPESRGLYNSDWRSLCPMLPDIARNRQSPGGSTFQCLHAGHLVDRDRADVLLRRGGRVLIDGADVGALGLELRVRLGREPTAHAMRL